MCGDEAHAAGACRDAAHEHVACPEAPAPSPPPSPPPAPPTPPPATPDWTGDRHSVWFCGVHLWPESARRRPQQGGQHPPHSGLDYERTHYALEQLHGYAAAG